MTRRRFPRHRSGVGATLVVARPERTRESPAPVLWSRARVLASVFHGTNPQPIEFRDEFVGATLVVARAGLPAASVDCHENAEHSRHAPEGRAGTGQARPLRPLFPARPRLDPGVETSMRLFELRLASCPMLGSAPRVPQCGRWPSRVASPPRHAPPPLRRRSSDPRRRWGRTTSVPRRR